MPDVTVEIYEDTERQKHWRILLKQVVVMQSCIIAYIRDCQGASPIG